MGYDLFYFGSLTMDGEAQKVPEFPTFNGDITQYDGNSSVSIGETISGKKIPWIKPKGLGIFVADRVLLVNISWLDLSKNGFVEGREVVIEGQRFRCRLPHVGATEGEPNEWNDILDAAGVANSLLHWHQIYLWGAERVSSTTLICAIRGWGFARRWARLVGTGASLRVGFRPVIDPLGFNKIVQNCILDGQYFQFDNLPGSLHFCPVLQPAQNDAFMDIPSGSKVRMYTFLNEGKPVRTDTNRKSKFRDMSQLELTDRYYGDEYLIPWTISNGVAVADKSLLIKTDNGEG